MEIKIVAVVVVVAKFLSKVIVFRRTNLLGALAARVSVLCQQRQFITNYNNLHKVNDIYNT